MFNISIYFNYSIITCSNISFKLSNIFDSASWWRPGHCQGLWPGSCPPLYSLGPPSPPQTPPQKVGKARLHLTPYLESDLPTTLAGAQLDQMRCSLGMPAATTKLAIRPKTGVMDKNVTVLRNLQPHLLPTLRGVVATSYSSYSKR